MWAITKKRLRFLAWPADSLYGRVAAFVAAVATALSIADASGKALMLANSGVLFTPVGGIATDFPFDNSRNPVGRLSNSHLLSVKCQPTRTLYDMASISRS